MQCMRPRCTGIGCSKTALLAASFAARDAEAGSATRLGGWVGPNKEGERATAQVGWVVPHAQTMKWVWEINRKVQCKCGGKKKERKRKRKLKEGERKGIVFYDEY